MTYKKKIKILLVLAIFSFVAALMMTESVLFGLCLEEEYFTCQEKLGNIGQPLGLFSIILIFLLIILHFTKPKVFKTWLKFAVPYLLLVSLPIILAPANNSGVYGVDSEILTWFFSGLFLFISVIIIGIKSYILKRRERSEREKK
jgi:tellurite resistance protein TehA-like permease